MLRIRSALVFTLGVVGLALDAVRSVAQPRTYPPRGWDWTSSYRDVVG